MEEQKVKILVAPLNWGLGHSTRNIPIIRELLKRNVEVIIAADGRPLDLLRKEFPQLRWLRLKGYDVRYPRNGNFAFHIFFQTPKVLRSIFFEKKWIRQIAEEEQLDAIITDNRFGVSYEKIPCIFITHQIGILMPWFFKWGEKMMYGWNRTFIEKFSECWIPDFEGVPNLTGKLSHHFPLPRNSFFIGPLSRMKKMEEAKKKYDVLFILSGQEPQRTLFEEILTEQARHLSLKMLMVRGVTEADSKISVTKNFMKADSMTAVELNDAMASSDLIVSRSGYSTVMDVVAMGKKALFIPTPGQTEQEYLSGVYAEQKLFYSVSQRELDLSRDIPIALQFPGMDYKESGERLPERIDHLLAKIKVHAILQPQSD